MRLDNLNTEQWKRVCTVASRLLDLPPDQREESLARECGSDPDTRDAVLRVCRDYSDTDDLFGVRPLAPLTLDDPQVGQQIGVWKVLRPLGEGGMGRVYLVERADDVFARHAALKLIRGFCDPSLARRFQAERRILAMLDHPAIARALDGGATPQGAPYLVMEYVDGRPIDQFCQGRPVREKIQLFLQVADAIDLAHRNLVVHRDLKPSNILVTAKGQAKVLDFGIAKLLEEGESVEHTRTGPQAMTPAYASPEQLLQEPATVSSDVYSLGAVLYKLLTGRAPHDLAGQNVLQSIRLVTRTSPEPPSRYAGELRGGLDAILLKALEPSPARRYSSAGDLARDLRCWLNGEPIAARPAPLDGWRRWRRRNPAKAWTIASAFLLLGLASLAVSIEPEWRFQWKARLLPVRKIPVEILGFESAVLSPDRLTQLFARDMSAGGLLAPHIASTVALLSADQIATLRSAGIRTVLTGNFDLAGSQPSATFKIRARVIHTADGRVVWTGAAQGSSTEIPALVAQLSRGMQEALGGREQAIRRARTDSPEARKFAREGLDAWLRFDLVKARIALEQAANLNIASAVIRLDLARSLNSLGYRDLARDAAAAALRLADNPADRSDAEALEQELAANWPHAIELRRSSPALGPAGQLSLAEDLIAAKQFKDAGALISAQLAGGTPAAGRNRWLLLRARGLREMPGRPGHLENSRRLVEAARESGPPLFLAEALDRLCESLTFAGDKAGSLAAAEESRQIFAQEGHREGMIRALAVQGQRLQIVGSTAEAIRLLEQGMRAVDGAGFDDTEHYIARVLGAAYGRGYDLDLGRQMLTRALALSWKNRDTDQSRIDRSRLGIVYKDLGQLDESRRLLRESLPPPGSQPEPEARVLNALGETELLAGNAQAALDAGVHAEKLAAAGRADDVRMDALTVIARALLLKGDASKVDENFALADEVNRRINMAGSVALAQLDWGQSLLIENKTSAARRHLEESVRQLERLDRPAFLAQAHALLAIALERTRNVAAAREVAAAQTLAKGTGFAVTRVLTDYAQAGLYAARGEREEAEETARAAIQEAEGFGFKPLAERIRAEFRQYAF